MPRVRKSVDSRRGTRGYPLVWNPKDVVIKQDDFRESLQPKKFDSAAWNRPLSDDERQELLLWDVNNAGLFRLKRADFIGATLGRDATGYAYGKTPNEVALETAGHKARKGSDEKLQRIFQYGHWGEAINKGVYRRVSGFGLSDTGFWANPAYNLESGTEQDRDDWFKRYWPALWYGLNEEHNQQPEELRELTRHLYQERRDAVLDAHYLVTTPDGLVDTTAAFESPEWPSTDVHRRLKALHDPETYGRKGVFEAKSHINDIYAPTLNRGAQIQMAFQCLCTMQDEHYETGYYVPWGHLVSGSTVTPLSRYWKRPKCRPLYAMEAYKVSFEGHNLMFELMEEIRRFKETVDTMQGMTLSEYNMQHGPFEVSQTFTMSDIKIEYMFDFQTDTDPNLLAD